MNWHQVFGNKTVTPQASSEHNPAGILLRFVFILFVLLNYSILRGPLEVQSPSEPLSRGQGGQQEIRLPQQQEASSVREVGGNKFSFQGGDGV